VLSLQKTIEEIRKPKRRQLRVRQGPDRPKAFMRTPVSCLTHQRCRRNMAPVDRLQECGLPCYLSSMAMNVSVGATGRASLLHILPFWLSPNFLSAFHAIHWPHSVFCFSRRSRRLRNHTSALDLVTVDCPRNQGGDYFVRN